MHILDLRDLDLCYQGHSTDFCNLHTIGNNSTTYEHHHSNNKKFKAVDNFENMLP